MTTHIHRRATDPIDPDIAALARVKLTVWVVIIAMVMAFAGGSFAIQQHGKEITELKEKKAENASVADKLDALVRVEEQRAIAFDRRLGAIEAFQRAQAEAAMKAATERDR